MTADFGSELTKSCDHEYSFMQSQLDERTHADQWRTTATHVVDADEGLDTISLLFHRPMPIHPPWVQFPKTILYQQVHKLGFVRTVEPACCARSS
jgi:hypothetical protein